MPVCSVNFLNTSGANISPAVVACLSRGMGGIPLRTRYRYTVGGVRRSVRELTGRDPIVIEHFQVSANRPDCADPALYRRLYGEDPHRCFVLLPEDTFSSQQERVRFQQSMADRLPAGVSMQLVQLKQCVQLDWHTYLGVNSRVGGYVAAAIDEQVTIHYDTTIGGANHE